MYGTLFCTTSPIWRCDRSTQCGVVVFFFFFALSFRAVYATFVLQRAEVRVGLMVDGRFVGLGFHVDGDDGRWLVDGMMDDGWLMGMMDDGIGHQS
jgi:hypothetical protein